MARLTTFNFVTLNGFYKGINGDISWHAHGTEENEYGVDMLKQNNMLLFGRVTYQLMEWYWQSEDAMKSDPATAKGMNNAEKIVFSKTLEKANWNKTTLVKEDMIEAVKQLKQTRNEDMAILGSGSVVIQLAEAGLIDEYLVMIDPVVLGQGTPLFQGINGSLSLQLVNARTFKSGAVLLTYHPA